VKYIGLSSGALYIMWELKKQCPSLEHIIVSVFKLSVIGLNVEVPSNVLKKLNSVVFVSVPKLSVIGLSVICLSIMAPSNVLKTNSTVGFL
jgi:hypothetical protein